MSNNVRMSKFPIELKSRGGKAPLRTLIPKDTEGI